MYVLSHYDRFLFIIRYIYIYVLSLIFAIHLLTHDSNYCEFITNVCMIYAGVILECIVPIPTDSNIYHGLQDFINLSLKSLSDQIPISIIYYILMYTL
jgi:hypothetical protein